MNKKGNSLKLELDELRNLTEELREVKEGETEACEQCERYAALAFRTAEKYYEMLIRAEIIESTWYRKGGTDCNLMECQPKQDVIDLQNTMSEAKDDLAKILNSSFNITNKKIIDEKDRRDNE